MRIAHLADLHLGYRAYHRTTPRGINVREDDVAHAFRHAVAQVVELRPDLVLVAGDVFHTVRPSNTAIAEAFRQFSVLTERLPGVPVAMIAGNHDSPRSADTGNILSLFREIEGVHVVHEESRPLRLPGLEATVLCLPHCALAGEQPVAMEPDAAARLNLLMLHGDITGGGAEEKLRYVTEYGGASVDQSRIRPERWDYVALGHYHLLRELAPNMWYPGGLERTSTNIWIEEDDKGFLLYDTDARTAEFHAVETRAIVDLPWIRSEGLTAAELDARIQASVESIDEGVRGKLVRMVVLDVPRALARDLNHRRIREWKADALHFHLDLRPPEVRRRSGSGAPARRQTLREQVESWLRHHWTPSGPEIDRERLVGMGVDYIDRTAEG
ncbi:MAG TPA: DNA repair exonuclease [Longimicrobiaceae bacterium]|nr:DNA repair exonuclease [Longimicrobiaceae bacterium]